MPNFYFHLRGVGSCTQFEERRDLPDLRSAMVEAQGSLRALIHNQVRRSPAPLHGSLDIEDESRQPVARILLADLARQIS